MLIVLLKAMGRVNCLTYDEHTISVLMTHTTCTNSPDKAGKNNYRISYVKSNGQLLHKGLQPYYVSLHIPIVITYDRKNNLHSCHMYYLNIYMQYVSIWKMKQFIYYKYIQVTFMAIICVEFVTWSRSDLSIFFLYN